MSVGPEHWPWQWLGAGAWGVADDLWEPEPEGLRRIPESLKPMGWKDRRFCILNQQASGIFVKHYPWPLLAKHLVKIGHMIISTPLKLQFKKSYKHMQENGTETRTSYLI